MSSENTSAKLPHAQPAQPPPKKATSATRKIIMAVIGLAAVVWLARTVWHAYHYEETDDAYIVGHIHQISPQISAQVKEVLVKDNQWVEAGAPLVRLDPLQFDIGVQRARAARAEAQSRLAQAIAATTQSDAQIVEAQARVEQAQAQVGQNDAQLELARLNLSRNEKLLAGGSGAVTQSDMDAYRSAAHNAEAAHAAALANLSAAKAGVTAAEAARKSADAAVATARSTIASVEATGHDAERELSYTTLTAPAAGHIGNKSVESGTRVQAGQVLFALTEPDVWIIANFKETQLAHMEKGQAVEVTVDAIPGQTFSGKIDSISPASGAQFALLPPDNATGNFNKIVQRIPVKIVLDEESAKRAGERLRLGFSVIVTIRVR